MGPQTEGMWRLSAWVRDHGYYDNWYGPRPATEMIKGSALRIYYQAGWDDARLDRRLYSDFGWD